MRGISAVVVLLAGITLFVYVSSSKIFTQAFLTKAKDTTLAKADQDADNLCALSEIETKENPNSHLFVSCGGFIE